MSPDETSLLDMALDGTTWDWLGPPPPTALVVNKDWVLDVETEVRLNRFTKAASPAGSSTEPHQGREPRMRQPPQERFVPNAFIAGDTLTLHQQALGLVNGWIGRTPKAMGLRALPDLNVRWAAQTGEPFVDQDDTLWT